MRSLLSDFKVGVVRNGSINSKDEPSRRIQRKNSTHSTGLCLSCEVILSSLDIGKKVNMMGDMKSILLNTLSIILVAIEENRDKPISQWQFPVL
jgi:hypothetical protein